MFSKHCSGNSSHEAAGCFLNLRCIQTFSENFTRGCRFSPWGGGEWWEKLYIGTEFSKQSPGQEVNCLKLTDVRKERLAKRLGQRVDILKAEGLMGML